MMMGYHISSQARDKILRKVAMAVLNQASSVFWIYSGKLCVEMLHVLLCIC